MPYSSGNENSKRLGNIELVCFLKSILPKLTLRAIRYELKYGLKLDIKKLSFTVLSKVYVFDVYVFILKYKK